MKKILLFGMLMFTIFSGKSQIIGNISALDKGNVSFVYLNAQNAHEAFAFMLLGELLPGEKLYFTNRPYTSSGLAFCDIGQLGWVIEYSVTDYAAPGQVVHIKDDGTNGIIMAQGIGNAVLVKGVFDLRDIQSGGNDGGCGIYCYKDATTDGFFNPGSFITAIYSLPQETVPDPCLSNYAYSPLSGIGLVNGFNAISFQKNGADQYKFDCRSYPTVVNGGDDPTVARAVLNSENNWLFNNGASLADFTLADYNCLMAAAAPLPVKFSMQLAGRLNKSKVDLSWATAFEQNAKIFEIERGVSPKDFSKVGEVAAKNISQGASYVFSDANVPKGKVFYRLKMVDIDGTYEYSNVALVNNNGVLVLDVFPNPASNKINIQVPEHGSAASLSILGADGKVFKRVSLNAEEYRKEVSIQELPSGSYFVVFNDGSQRLTARFSKQ